MTKDREERGVIGQVWKSATLARLHLKKIYTVNGEPDLVAYFITAVMLSIISTILLGL